MTFRSTTPESTVNKILTEDVLTMSEARAEIFRATGRRPDKSTITRWIHRGVGGTRLESIRLGSQLLVSKQAIHRFLVSRTETIKTK